MLLSHTKERFEGFLTSSKRELLNSILSKNREVNFLMADISVKGTGSNITEEYKIKIFPIGSNVSIVSHGNHLQISGKFFKKTNFKTQKTLPKFEAWGVFSPVSKIVRLKSITRFNSLRLSTSSSSTLEFLMRSHFPNGVVFDTPELTIAFPEERPFDPATFDSIYFEFINKARYLQLVPYDPKKDSYIIYFRPYLSKKFFKFCLEHQDGLYKTKEGHVVFEKGELVLDKELPLSNIKFSLSYKNVSDFSNWIQSKKNQCGLELEHTLHGKIFSNIKPMSKEKPISTQLLLKKIDEITCLMKYK